MSRRFTAPPMRPASMIRCTWRSGTPVTDAASFAVISAVWFAAMRISKILPRLWKHISHKDPLCHYVRLSAQPFIFTLPNAGMKVLASAPAEGQRWSFRASQVVDEGQSVPGRSGRASPNMPVHTFVVTNRILGLCISVPRRTRPRRRRREGAFRSWPPFCRRRRERALDSAPWGLALLSQASDGHQVSLGLSAGAPLLPRMG